MDDRELIQGLQAGARSALRQAMETYGGYAAAVLGRTLGNQAALEDVEELLSDVFLTLWTHREELDGDKSLKAWLATVARNRAFNRLRDRREELPLEEDALLLSPDSPHVEAEQGELREVLSRALGSLDKADRELFVRHYYYDQTVAKAAEEMGLNLSTAKTRLRRGRERLKDYLQEVGYELAEG